MYWCNNLHRQAQAHSPQPTALGHMASPAAQVVLVLQRCDMNLRQWAEAERRREQEQAPEAWAATALRQGGGAGGC